MYIYLNKCKMCVNIYKMFKYIYEVTEEHIHIVCKNRSVLVSNVCVQWTVFAQ